MEQTIQDSVLDLFHQLGIDCGVSISKMERSDSSDGYAVSITSDQNMSLFAGREGSNLGSFEHLIRILVARKLEASKTLPFISIDINNVRKEKHEKIASLARAVAMRVKENKRPEIMPPMDAFERRIIHNELASALDIETESIGIDPNRRIVVKPTLV